jgi:hypothetical protein
MHKSATKCNETPSKWCKNKHGASKIIDTFETYHTTIRPRVSWAHELSKEEMKTTQPLMEKIQQLRAMPKKELSGLQLIRTFIEHRVQPLSARAHCMWDYTDRRDSTRISFDKLKEAEIDDGVHAVTSLKKKLIVPKTFGTEAFSKSNPHTEVFDKFPVKF